MKAVRLHKEGGPERLVYEDAPKPQLDAGEALIECTPRHYAGRVDLCGDLQELRREVGVGGRQAMSAPLTRTQRLVAGMHR